MNKEAKGASHTDLRKLTKEEAWQITCHEAGHAVVGVRLDIPFIRVERRKGEHGEVPVGVGPVEDTNHSWTDDQISRWQKFYAAGPAAEKFLFGKYRDYGSRKDRLLHDILEERWRPNRTGGWEQDIQSAINILDREALEKVGRELDRCGILDVEEVYSLLGCTPPWLLEPRSN